MFCVFVFRLRVCVLPYYIKGLLDVENSSNILLVSGSQFLWYTSDFTFETVLEKKKSKNSPITFNEDLIKKDVFNMFHLHITKVQQTEISELLTH